MARARVASGVVAALLALAGASAFAADTWVETRSPHFLVVSDAGPKQAQSVAWQFEQIRAMFQRTWSWARLDPGKPIVILATRDERGLEQLLPEYWETKGAVHPAGIFVSGPEKHYVALRTDLASARAEENPYRILYHEYVHLILDLNFERVPAWFGEGMAEFYGNTIIRDDAILQGKVILSHILTLRDRARLPLEQLLAVDGSSPEYREDTRATLFYAQSWALIHYLIMGRPDARAHPLNDFASLMDQGVEPAEATRRALGDLAALGKALDAYVRSYAFTYRRLALSVDAGSREFPTRALSAAESAAVRGDFHLYMHRPAEARALLAQALELDPTLAATHTSLGLMYLHDGKTEDARREIGRAVELDSSSYLVHYLHATLGMEGTSAADALAEAEASLLRSVQLNHDFAPAYALLAEVSAARGKRLDDVLPVARRAIDLEPGAVAHRLALGRILGGAGKGDEARTEGERALAMARTDGDRRLARSFLESLAPTPPAAVVALDDGCAPGSATDCAPRGEGRSDRSAAPNDPAQAVLFYQERCDAGQAEACAVLATLYDSGSGVAKDRGRAIGLYQKACEDRFAPACTDLGVLRLSRNEIAQSVPLFEQGCESGDPRACFNLAALEDSGLGVAKDPARARALYRQACEAGYRPACGKLGATAK